jgi:hypothetical protein
VVLALEWSWMILLRWFYDTFLGTVIRAVYEVSLIGGTKALSSQGVIYEGTW